MTQIARGNGSTFSKVINALNEAAVMSSYRPRNRMLFVKSSSLIRLHS